MIVGFCAGVAVGKKSGVTGSIIAALAAVAGHEALDAPVARLLSELGL